MAQEMLNAPYLKRSKSRINREEDSPIRKKLCFDAVNQEGGNKTPIKSILNGCLTSFVEKEKTPSSIKMEGETEIINLVTPPQLPTSPVNEWQEFEFPEENSVIEQSLHFELPPLPSNTLETANSLEKSIAINSLQT